MSEWRSVWRVTLRFGDSSRNGGYPYRQVRAGTPRELRRVIEWARANPDVLGFPYQRVRERVGEIPQVCRNGHSYDGTSAFRARCDWADCGCGGHVAYVCRWAGCDDIRIDPEVFHDCTVSPEAIIASSRRRGLDRD
jgi:hypothetical protein